MVSGTRALLEWFVHWVEGGAGQRPQSGQSPVEHRGNLSVHRSIRSYIPPPSSELCFLWGLFWPKFCQIAQIHVIWPESKQNGPNPSIMAQIQAKWPKSGQKTPSLAQGPSFWPLRPILWPSIPRFWPEFILSRNLYWAGLSVMWK